MAKTMELMRRLGFIADKVEYTGSVGAHYTKRDLWGSDIIYRNALEIGFVQVKTSEKQVSEGKRQLNQDSEWPSSVVRLVCIWAPRSRRPAMHIVGGSACQPVLCERMAS